MVRVRGETFSMGNVSNQTISSFIPQLLHPSSQLLFPIVIQCHFSSLSSPAQRIFLDIGHAWQASCPAGKSRNDPEDPCCTRLVAIWSTRKLYISNKTLEPKNMKAASIVCQIASEAQMPHQTHFFPSTPNARSLDASDHLPTILSTPAVTTRPTFAKTPEQSTASHFPSKPPDLIRVTKASLSTICCPTGSMVVASTAS